MLIKSAAGLDAAWRGARLCDMARAVVVGSAPTWITGIVVIRGHKGCNQVIWPIGGSGVTFNRNENFIMRP